MAPSILSYVDHHVAVLAGSQQCTSRPGTAKPADTHVLVAMAWSCPPDGELRYRVTLFQDVDPAARHLALISAGSGEHELTLDHSVPEIALSGAGSSVLQIAGRFVAAGIEHIFLGYDHVAFLIAVILWGQRLWPLIKVVTAFTVAHSLTLTLAVLDVVRLPSSVVEPLIAATIVYVAAENFFVRDISKRWRVTFLLGLVHGFGRCVARIWLAPGRAAASVGGIQYRRRDRASGDRGPDLSPFVMVGSSRRRSRKGTERRAGIQLFRSDPGVWALLADRARRVRAFIGCDAFPGYIKGASQTRSSTCL
jgi:hypothetical protein